MLRAPTVAYVVVHDATDDAIATLTQPEIGEVSDVNVTVPVADGDTVAVKVTEIVACSVVGVRTSVVVVWVDIARGVTVMVPLPPLLAPTNTVESAPAYAQDEPPPPPPPGMLLVW